ncbi:magnesium ion transporter, partial [Coemansia sp. RSA 2440]
MSAALRLRSTLHVSMRSALPDVVVPRMRVYPSSRAFSFNMFDLLPDLESLRKRRSKKLEDAVGRGTVGKGTEHPTLATKGARLDKQTDTQRDKYTDTQRDKYTDIQRDKYTDTQTQTDKRAPLMQEVYRYQRSAGLGGPVRTSAQQGPDLTLRCTELDKHGNITVRAGEFQKSELCAQHGLQARDLRKIDSKFVNQMPAILVRRHAILVNLLHIRALIEADRIVLFDSIGAHSQGNLVYELQERLRSNARAGPAELAQPFEFRALEAVLISVVGSLQSDEEVLVNLVQNLLAYLEESVDRAKLRELLQYSKRLSRFEQK